MTDYKIRIIVEGEDRASGPIGRVSSALGGMGTVAGGILGAQALMGLARSLIGVGTAAIGATANLQAMEIGMASLAAKEIATTENTRRLAEAAEQGLDASSVALMKISEALPEAEAKASVMMEELAKIAIVSPYQLQVVQGSYQMAQAFGYTGEEAMKFTKALLNVGAGVGADNERLSRMAYNLAQIRMVGKVTAVDFRQLAMAGFDLGSVLQYIGRETGVAIKDYQDFNAALANGQITWEQFTDLFMKYADENFGGAAERMSRTLKGLASTFQDLMILTFPKILGPAAETFTGFANQVLDAFLLIRDSGILEDMAIGIDNWMKGITATLKPFVDNVTNLIEAIADAGLKSSEAHEALGLLIGEKNLAALDRMKQIFQDVVNAVRPFVQMVAEFIAKNVKISDALTAIGVLVAATVIPALISAAAAFLPFLALVGIIALVRNAWQNNWYGIRDTLTEAWNTSILPALQQLWAWLQVNIPLALQTLSIYWQTVLLPALQAAWAWISTNIIPLLLQLWTWLQINLPLAVQALSAFWTNTLLPAIQAVGTWITGTLIPAISNLWTWLSTNIPAAIQTVSDYWTGTLQPALQTVWSYLDTNIFPLITALNDLLGAIFGKTIEALAGLWQNVLYPAFKIVADFIKTNVTPTVDKLNTGIGTKLMPVLRTLSSFLSFTLKAAFAGITSAIQTVIGWLATLATKIANIKLPGWLTPGSPTPFEIALNGIASALKDVNRAFDGPFSFSLVAGGGTGPVSGGAGGGYSGDTYIEQNFFDAGAAAVGMAQVATMRRQRINSSMGG